MLKYFLIFITTCLVTNIQASTFQINYQRLDTNGLETRLKEKMIQFKKQNKLQLYKFVNPDSSIVFGSNKQKTFLTSVMVLDKTRNENRWYYFDSDGLFRVSIAERQRPNGTRRKKSTSSYYFENGVFVYKIEEEIKYEPTKLLSEANNYLDLATRYINKN
jgi:hypothetical protein